MFSETVPAREEMLLEQLWRYVAYTVCVKCGLFVLVWRLHEFELIQSHDVALALSDSFCCSEESLYSELSMRVANCVQFQQRQWLIFFFLFCADYYVVRHFERKNYWQYP